MNQVIISVKFPKTYMDLLIHIFGNLPEEYYLTVVMLQNLLEADTTTFTLDIIHKN